MLLECGPTRAADRIYSFMQQSGIKKIDYLFITHFEDDHIGAAPALSEKVPIVNWVDHGGA
jgi:competence protein ComEC